MATVTEVRAKLDQINEADFQIICDQYLSKKGYPNIVCLGTEAGAHKTTSGTPDTYFCRDDGKYVFVEYTTKQKGLIGKIREDLQKCLDKSITKINYCDIAEIIYLHNSSNIPPKYDKEFKELCKKKRIKLKIVGIDQLAFDLLNYPSIIKHYLHLPIGTEQIQSIDDFIELYNSNKLSASLSTPFFFREEEIKTIETLLQKHDIIVLSGRAGVGKTKLALHIAEKYAVENSSKIYCIHNRAMPLYDELRSLLENPGNYFLVLDDANQISQIEHIAEYVNKKSFGYNVKIIVTARDYATKKVADILQKIAPIKEINLQPFKDEEIKDIVRKSLNILNEECLDRIVRIAEGNARLAILSGKIALDSNKLSSINDASQLYDKYYGECLRETILQKGKSLLVTACIMATLDTLHLDKLEPLLPWLMYCNLSKEQFVEDLYTLCELEIVDIYRDKAVKFSEQCFSNFIVKYSFYDTKALSLSSFIEICIKPYHHKVVSTVDTLLNIFFNDDIFNFVRLEINSLWDKLKATNSPDLLTYVEAFHPINPAEALVYLQTLIDETVPIILSAEELDTSTNKNYKSVNDSIISMLGSFADTEDLDCALDLLLQYYLKRPDKYMDFYHAITTHFTPRLNSLNNKFYTENIVLQKITEYSNNWNNELITVLFLDLAREFLKVMFNPAAMDRTGRSMRIYNIYLQQAEGVLEYRSTIWNNLQLISNNKKYQPQIEKLLLNYPSGFHEESHGVIRDDIPFVEKLVSSTLKENNLLHYEIVEHLIDIFGHVGVENTALNSFLNVDKVVLYNVLKGPKYRLHDGDTRDEQKKEQIRKLYLESKDKIETFKSLLKICCEVGIDNYEANNGLDIYMSEMSADSACFDAMVDYVIESQLAMHVNAYLIIKNLLSRHDSDHVLNVIGRISDIGNHNNWLFAYYELIAADRISITLAKSVYSFIDTESDQTINAQTRRDANFLYKFESVDSGITLACIKKIFDKRDSSPNTVRSYFRHILNEHNNSPEELTSKFSNDIELLEDIYIWLENNVHYNDYRASFMIAIYKQSHRILEKFVRSKIESSNFSRYDDSLKKIRRFYGIEDYITVFDATLDYAFAYAKYPSFLVPEIISLIIGAEEGKEENIDKANNWLIHYISVNAVDETKMHCAFEGFASCPIERKLQFVKAFIDNNSSYDMFEKMPLTPRSFGGTNSFISVYQGWIDYFKKMLPLFRGAKFIKHKNKVNGLIDQTNKMIEEEEVSNILQGF